MPVGELLSRMSSRELTEWEAFTRVEPIGEEREDIRIAILSALIANTSRDIKKKPDPFSPVDFIIDYWEPVKPVKQEPNWKANLMMAELITIALGGTDNRKK
jgi:hypothetical protein